MFFYFISGLGIAVGEHQKYLFPKLTSNNGNGSSKFVTNTLRDAASKVPSLRSVSTKVTSRSLRVGSANEVMQLSEKRIYAQVMGGWNQSTSNSEGAMGSYITDATEYLILTRAVKCLAGRRNYKKCYFEPNLVKVYDYVDVSQQRQAFLNFISDIMYLSGRPIFNHASKLWKVTETLFAVFLVRYEEYNRKYPLCKGIKFVRDRLKSFLATSTQEKGDVNYSHKLLIDKYIH